MAECTAKFPAYPPPNTFQFAAAGQPGTYTYDILMRQFMCYMLGTWPFLHAHLRSVLLLECSRVGCHSAGASLSAYSQAH